MQSFQKRAQTKDDMRKKKSMSLERSSCKKRRRIRVIPPHPAPAAMRSNKTRKGKKKHKKKKSKNRYRTKSPIPETSRSCVVKINSSGNYQTPWSNTRMDISTSSYQKRSEGVNSKDHSRTIKLTRSKKNG